MKAIEKIKKGMPVTFEGDSVRNADAKNIKGIALNNAEIGQDVMILTADIQGLFIPFNDDMPDYMRPDKP